MTVIRGYIEHFIYRNTDNGYCVLNFVTGDEEITCVGSFPDVNEGEYLELKGEVITHPVYGEQLKVSEYETVPPEDSEAMERYLGSGAIKGIGAALAGRIVSRFGDDTFRIIEEEPERLAEIKGITERKAIDIAMQMAEKREQREAMLFLQQYGISTALSVRIFERYGTRVHDILRENPYRLAEDIDGIGFKTADEIASRIGIRHDDGMRIRCGLLYVLSSSSMDGHTYLPLDELLVRTRRILDISDEQSIRDELGSLAIERKVIMREDPSAEDPGDNPAVFQASSFYAEQGCATRLRDLVRDTESAQGRLPFIRARLDELCGESGITLDELQIKAVEMSLSCGVMILSGGPGTGKTTTIKTILSICEKEKLDVLLAAPTGRAAKRMTEATGYEARTIHRLLEVTGKPLDDREDPSKRERVIFERDSDHPLEADVIIIDEMSMVDIYLFHALLKAVIPGTQLVLVGDSAQLPSVGPGQVLKDLIDSGHFPTVILKKIFRQAEESDIVMNAHRINRGERIKLDNKGSDFFFLPRDNAEVIYKHLVTLIKDKLPGYVGAPVEELQVLTPMRKGPLGAAGLNHILQEHLNPPSGRKKEHLFGELLLREGDKVMQTKNDYQAQWEITGRNNIVIDSGTGIYNGDMGRILSIDESSRELLVEFDDHRKVRMDFSAVENLELAYAITIHKSQGSEYPAVLLPILSGPPMLMNRNLLYTAVTRAKRLVIILGSEQAIVSMIDNDRQLVRYTGLKDRINDFFTDRQQE